MKITTDNVHEAENAIRDILYMYHDLVRSYKGFGHTLIAVNLIRSITSTQY